MKSTIPEICDYDCPHADFPPAATAGICRTMSAVWCKKLKELVNKNLPCEWRKRDGQKAAARTTRATTKRKPATKTAAKKTAKQAVKKTAGKAKSTKAARRR